MSRRTRHFSVGTALLTTLLLCLLLNESNAFAPLSQTQQSRIHGIATTTRISSNNNDSRRVPFLSAVSKDTAANDSVGASIKTAILSTIMGLTVLLSSPPSFDTLHTPLLTPPPAFAIEQQQQQVDIATAADPERAPEQMSPDNLVGIPPLPKQQAQVNQVLQPSTTIPPKQQDSYSVVNEVWNLVNKFYIDRSFHGQDWNKVRTRYETAAKSSPDDDMKLATEMVKLLGDKYSRMLDTDQYAAIQKFDLIGVGVTLMPNEQKQIVVGAPPIQGSASQKAGLRVGDLVLAVNDVPTSGKSAFDIIDQISDDPNAPTVKFTIQTLGEDSLAGEGITREVTMPRSFAKVNDPIKYKISEIRGDGTKVGFVKISEFNSLVKAKLANAFQDLQEQGANAFVLDLRGNPGGAFQSAVEISSLFVSNRVATYVVDSNGVELPFKTMADRVVVSPEYPVAIWVDGGSASASEVLAGSLHDNCRAVIMGKQSFGKGLIQAVYGLKNGAGLVLTVAKYVTPNGTEIQGEGVTPDVEGGVPLNLPIVGTDTSKVDFADISSRLGPNMCRVPTPH